LRRILLRKRKELEENLRKERRKKKLQPQIKRRKRLIHL